MFPKKSAKPPKKAFTNEQIRARAYQIWEKNKEQSEEENWNAAIKALERERRFRVLIGIWRWTGLGEKKGWDIVTSLSIPLIVFGGGILFNYLNGKQQQEVAEQKQKDELLKTYINDMKGFLLDEKHSLKKSKENDEIRSIARTITLTTLTQLNSNQDEQRSKEGKYNQRKGLIMQFLFESDLIGTHDKAPIISFYKADFNFVELGGASFLFANLGFANLYGANLYNAELSVAELYDVNLARANLTGARFQASNLREANLLYANLTTANLAGADLLYARIYGANLTDTILYNARNLTNGQIKSACFWQKAIYTMITFGDNGHLFVAKNAKANQQRINEIKQDKASDPKTPPDCSEWK